jgi:ribosome-associated translation inhibitor RaiA
MQIPLQVTFEGSDPSEPVRVAIEREVERLEEHNRHIIGCHVAVIAPSHKHRHGSGFRVHISITVSPHENVIVNHAPSDDPAPSNEGWFRPLEVVAPPGTIFTAELPAAVGRPRNLL